MTAQTISAIEIAELRLLLDRAGKTDWRVDPRPREVIISDANNRKMARLVKQNNYWHEHSAVNMAVHMCGRAYLPLAIKPTPQLVMQAVLTVYEKALEPEFRTKCHTCKKRRLCNYETLLSKPHCRQCRKAGCNE